MRVFWHILVFLVLLGFSCKKKEFPESVTETESDFYFKATVNGAPVSLRAGLDNYFMYSSVGSDSSKVLAFTADLKTQNCTSCANSIRISINDFKISQPNESAQIDSSLKAASYPLFSGENHYSVSFKSNYNHTAANYLWDFGDNMKSTVANPTHTYSSAGNYSVSLRITGTNSCQQYIKKVEKIRYPNKNCDISVLSDTGNTIKCEPIVLGRAPYKVLWDFGDGSKADTVTAFHSYEIPGTYPVSLRVIDADKDTSYAKYNYATQTNPMPCLTNYTIESIIPILDNSPFRRVTITWTDESGVEYTSSDIMQPAASYFKIISVEEYEPNERNEKTKKIKVQFKCNVYNGSKFKTLDNVDAVLCVSYK